MKNLTKNLLEIVSVSVSVSVIVFVFGLASPIAVLAAGPASISLGSAGNFVILAKTGVSTTGTTSVVGDIGLSPAAATFITGFSLNLPAASAFSTSSLVTGKVYAPGYADPTPANLTTAVNDMQNAYTAAAGITNPTATELGAGNIGGLTLAPGLYKWATGVTIPTDVTLSGSANDVWVFQIAQNLTTSSVTHVVLSGGAQASNIFWQVAGQATLGTNSSFNGNILSQTGIVLNTGATLNGRALAQSAVTLDSNAVTMPSYTVPIPSTVPIPTLSPGPGPSYTTNPTPCPLGTVAIGMTAGMPGSYICSAPTITATPITPTVSYTGCSGGNTYNDETGALCINSIVTASKYNFGTSTLRNGSRGDSVKELQRFLNAKLNLGLILDGSLGPKTIAVIKKWQKDHGLVADGLIGVKTKLQMNAEVSN